MNNEDLTPNVNIIPDPNSPEAKFFKEEATQEDEDNGTEERGSTPKEPEVDYRIKFSESTKENQRIMAENKATQERLARIEAHASTLEEEKAELERQLRSEKPDSFEAIQVKKELNELKRDIILQKERDAINDYVDSNPEAARHKEALKSLGRANPTLSYSEIYDRMIKPVYEAGMKDYEEKQKIKKQIQPETGRGSVEKGPDEEKEENFSNLSLEERRRKFKAMGL